MAHALGAYERTLVTPLAATVGPDDALRWSLILAVSVGVTVWLLLRARRRSRGA